MRTLNDVDKAKFAFFRLLSQKHMNQIYVLNNDSFLLITKLYVFASMKISAGINSIKSFLKL